MSSTSPIPPLDRDGQERWSKGCSGLTQQVCGVSRFVRGFATQLRFGQLSRSPLQLARLLINHDRAECDWIARDQDRWDVDLSRDIGRRHASLQALKDAIEIRALLFASLPQLSRARFRVYGGFNHPSELIIVGLVHRDESAHRSVHSLAMRAKLVGLRFNMDGEGFLRRLSREEQFGFCD